MQNNYEVVPNILTGKDLDYLVDMFNWNYGALKKTNYFLNLVNDEEIRQRLNEAISLFNENLNKILNILKEDLNEQ